MTREEKKLFEEQLRKLGNILYRLDDFRRQLDETCAFILTYIKDSEDEEAR